MFFALKELSCYIIMKKTIHETSIKILSIVVFIFFSVWGIIDIIIRNNDYIADRFFIASLALVSYFLYKRLHMNISIMLVGLAAIMLHSLKLYGNTYLGLSFDHYMHFIGGFATALIFYNYLYHELKKKGHLQIFILAVCITAGLGSFMEIMEFTGYSLFGEGNGLLFYGAGDFGEWNNAAWDMIYNTLGAVIASFTCFFLNLQKIRRKR